MRNRLASCITAPPQAPELQFFSRTRPFWPPCRAKIGGLSQCLILALALAAFFCFPPQESMCREAGWVPLEQSSKMAREMASEVPAKSQKVFQSEKMESRTASSQAGRAPQAAKAGAKASSVYDGQPVVREAELYEFLKLLPQFRAWCVSHGEEAHPVLNAEQKPDFKYSPQAAAWVRAHGLEPARFFCVMGRMAAALAIVEEGNYYAGSRPKDMPPVDAKELDLARKHLGELLSAGGAPGPIR